MAGRRRQNQQQQNGKATGDNKNEKEKNQRHRTTTSTNNQQLESARTMSFGQQVAIWAPRIISWLPQIIKAGHDIYALWCKIRDDQRQDDAVLKAMRLLNKNEDDIDRVLQNPAEKRALLEGLTILVNRINEHERGQARGGGFTNGKTSFPSPSFPSERSNADDYGSSSFRSSSSSYPSPSSEKSSGPIGSYKDCQVCYSAYNMTDRKPTVLICGHTFCRECMGYEVHIRGSLRCPLCKTLERRPLAALPLDYALVDYLDEQNQNKGACGMNGAYGDDSCSYSGDDSFGCGGDSCGGNGLSFEQQIEYAIQLSQQEAQAQGASYVEKKWQEVVVSEEEDMMLAMAIQASEVYEESRRCAEQQVERGACCLDSVREQEQNGDDDCSKWRHSKEDNDNDDDCSNWRHSRKDDDDNEDDCSKWKCSKKGSNEYDDDDCSKWKCSKEDCTDGEKDEETKKKHLAFLHDEEEVLIQMAIRASLEEQNGYADLPALEEDNTDK